MRRVLAIARNTIAQGLRMRAPLIVIIFLLVVMPVLPLLLKSDGSVKGQAQLILTYSLNVASFMLCMLAVFMSVSTLTSDLSEKQIYTLDVTRAGRWEILFGKWMGVVCLSAVLLALMGVSIYAMVKTVVKPGNEAERRILYQEVFTARARVQPEPEDTAALAKEYFERFKREGRLPDDVDENSALRTIQNFAEKYSNTVPARFPKRWQFRNLPVPENPDETMMVRYKLNAAQKPADGTVRCRWRFTNESSEKEYSVMTREQAGSLHEFEVPASMVGADGTFIVDFLCLEDTSIIFDSEKGLEILYRAGSFEANFLKCLAFVLLKVAFLAAVGLFAGTFLTFPVASLAALSVFGVALVSGSAVGIMNLKPPLSIPLVSGGTDGFDSSFQLLWRAVLFIIPDFSRYSGIARVALGEIISARDLAVSVGLVAVLRGGILMCLGALILSRRELAVVEE